MGRWVRDARRPPVAVAIAGGIRAEHGAEMLQGQVRVDIASGGDARIIDIGSNAVAGFDLCCLLEGHDQEVKEVMGKRSNAASLVTEAPNANVRRSVDLKMLVSA